MTRDSCYEFCEADVSRIATDCHWNDIGVSGFLSATPGTYDLSVTDADAMDTIDTQPAITIYG